MSEGSELDALAVQMENAVDRFIGNQNASKKFVLARLSSEQSLVGAYPQALLDKSKKSLEDDGDSYYDRFPTIYEPLALKLARSAKWTDVLSAQLWSEGYLLSEAALETFEQFELGNCQKFKAEVKHGKNMRQYTYMFFANHITKDDIDFGKSEFYVADMLGSPKKTIVVKNLSDYERARADATGGKLDGCGKFSRIACKAIKLRRGKAPKAAVFGMSDLGVEMYFKRELFLKLQSSQITGFTFKRNNMLFD